jgi:hypothetical protein
VRSGKVNYRARYRDPAGRERSKSFSRKVDAERWVAEIEHAKTRGAWTDPALGRVRFSDWLAAWWATTTNLRPTTRARDETLLRLYAIPRFGDMPLAAISQLEVRVWVADLSTRGFAPGHHHQGVPAPRQGHGRCGRCRLPGPVTVPQCPTAQGRA